MYNLYHLDDIVFEYKNKSYRAYTLRRDYHHNMNKAMLIILVTLFTAVCIAIHHYRNISTQIADEVEKVVTIENLDIEEILPETKPPKSKEAEASAPAKLKEATIEYVEPNVVNNHEPVTEQNFPIIDSLSTKIISNVNKEGTAGDGNLSSHIENNISGSGNSETSISNVIVDKKDEISNYAEVMPEFPGGFTALMKFLSSNIRYPVLARENNITGKIVMKFTVLKTGEIKDIKAISSIDPLLEKEVIRVLKLMPKWKPGMIKNNTVNVSFVLPVHFNLDN
jgi:protein TonB